MRDRLMFEIDNYTSRIEWTEISNEDSEVPESGLYLFNCRGDNHTFFELHQLIKGEKLCKHYLDHHFDGWAVVKPIEYHFVEKEEEEFVLQNRKHVDLFMSYIEYFNDLLSSVEEGVNKRSFSRGSVHNYFCHLPIRGKCPGWPEEVYSITDKALVKLYLYSIDEGFLEDGATYKDFLEFGIKRE